MSSVLFIQNVMFDFFGPMIMTAQLKENGHRARILIETSPSRILDRIERERIDIAAFTVLTGSQDWPLSVARLIKSRRPETLVVFGGAHPTFFPEEVIRHDGVDALCVGEGEGAMLDLARACGAGQDIAGIPNLWARKGGRIFKNRPRPLIDDLDGLPFPDRTHYRDYPQLGDSPWKAVVSGRGCPFRCSFCFNESYNAIYGAGGTAHMRKRSTRSIAAEIEAVRREWPTREIHFWDDAFNVRKDWLESFTETYPKLCPVPFRCDLRIDLTDEKEIMALKAAGCKTSLFGLESGSERLRKTVLGKPISNRDIVEGAALLRKHGIRFGTFNMLGLPGETLAEAFETVELNIRIGTDFPWCAIAQPYPNTELYRIARGLGLIASGRPAFPMSFFARSVLQQPDIRRVERLQKLFYLAVRCPRLLPLIRHIVRIPSGPLYFLVFALSQVRRHQRTYSMSLLETLRSFWGMLGSYFRTAKEES